MYLRYFFSSENFCNLTKVSYFRGRFSNFTKITVSVHSIVITEKLINVIVNFCFKVYFLGQNTDYGRPERKQPSMHGRKFNPNPKFLGTAEAYFVCHIGPIFQISLIYAFIGCPQSVVYEIKFEFHFTEILTPLCKMQQSSEAVSGWPCEKWVARIEITLKVLLQYVQQ